MRQIPVRYRLPVSYSTEIGRFITRWAYLEWVLNEALYSLMEISPKAGRIAVREPKIEIRLTMIQQIARLKNVSISVDWKKLKSTLQDMESFRNKLAHGIWLKDSSSDFPALRQVSGSYIAKAGAPSVNARISPASIPVPLRELKNAVAGVNRANQIIHEIKDEIEAQLSP